MTEHKGYECDGGCGTCIVLDPNDVLDSPTRHGWYTVLTPGRLPTVHACSADCVTEALRLARAHVYDSDVRFTPAAPCTSGAVWVPPVRTDG